MERDGEHVCRLDCRKASDAGLSIHLALFIVYSAYNLIN